MNVISPESSAIAAGPPPLYGTCTSFVPVMLLKSSPVRWLIAPLPLEPYVSCPGCAFASAISSLMFFTGSDGCTTTTCGTAESQMIGAKSLSLKGSFA